MTQGKYKKTLTKRVRKGMKAGLIRSTPITK